MLPSNISEMTKGWDTFLTRWRGAKAEIQQLQSSHLKLEICLSMPEKPGHLSIMAGPMRFICGPIHWAEACIQFAAGSDGLWVLYDADHGFCAIAEGIGIFEHESG